MEPQPPACQEERLRNNQLHQTPGAFHRPVPDIQPALTTTQVITIACLAPPQLDLRQALQFGTIIALYCEIILP